MKKFTWIIALAAILAMVFAGFAGCKDEGDGDDDNNTPSGPKTVTMLAIAGIQVPERNEAPDTSIESNVQYTGVLTWVKTGTSDAPGATFSEGSYTANITLTAKEGWTFNGINADTFQVFDAEVTHLAGESTTIDIEAVFPEWDGVIYDMKKDKHLSAFHNTTAGGSSSSDILGGGLFSWSTSDNLGGMVVDMETKTISCARSGTGQGIRLQVDFLRTIIKPNHFYTIEFAIESAGGIGDARLRTETPPDGTQVVLSQGSYVQAYGVEIVSETGAPNKSSLSATFSTEQLKLPADSGDYPSLRNRISLGNTSGNSEPITYTKIILRESADDPRL